MSRSSIAILASSLLVLAACDEKKPDAPAEDPATKNAAAPTAEPAAVAIADSDLSTPADFEETAEKAIDKASYKAELAALEIDIDKE